MAGRKSGRTAVLAIILGLGAVGPGLRAQVGHAPQGSPYRDVRRGTSWSLLFGNLSGDGGEIRVGPHNGPSYGARFDFRMSGFIQGGVSAWYMDLERFIVDADDSVATRVTGPVSQSVVLIEAALQFNITGGKTWHNIQPYFTGGLGYNISSSTNADTSGYEFGNRFSISPGVGFRYFLGDRLHLRIETRRHFWKLKYPSAYAEEPADEPGTEDDPNAVIRGNLNEWASGWWYFGGLGFSF
jgi:Lipid A 3-O-deacylase (PagL)